MTAAPAGWRRGVLAVAFALALAAPQAAGARTGHAHGIGHSFGRQAHHVRNKNCMNHPCTAPHAVDTPK